MNKIFQTSLIVPVLATCGFSATMTIDDETRIFAKEFDISGKTITVTNTPVNTNKGAVYTFGQIKADTAATFQNEHTYEGDSGKVSLYNGYYFDKGTEDAEYQIYGGIDGTVHLPTGDVSGTQWPVSVMRSFGEYSKAVGQVDAGGNALKDLTGASINLSTENATNPIFFVSPTINDQAGMQMLIDKGVSFKTAEDEAPDLLVIMQGDKETDSENWDKLGMTGDPYRYLKLDVFKNIHSQTTLVGKCELKVDNEKSIYIPTSFVSDSIDNYNTAGGSKTKYTGIDVSTDITIDAGTHDASGETENNTIIFGGNLDFSNGSNSVTFKRGTYVIEGTLKL